MGKLKPPQKEVIWHAHGVEMPETVHQIQRTRVDQDLHARAWGEDSRKTEWGGGRTGRTVQVAGYLRQSFSETFWSLDEKPSIPEGKPSLHSFSPTPGLGGVFYGNPSAHSTRVRHLTHWIKYQSLTENSFKVESWLKLIQDYMGATILVMLGDPGKGYLFFF